MALTNSKSCYYTIRGERAPNGFEEEMVYQFIKFFKEGRCSEGLSILLFYIVAKADQVEIDHFLSDRLEELADFIEETGEAAEVLLQQFAYKESLSDKDLRRIRHLQQIIGLSENLETGFGPRQFDNSEFNEEQCMFFLSNLIKFKQHLRLAGIDPAPFNRCIHCIVHELQNLEDTFKRWVDVTAIEAEALKEMYQLFTFSKLAETVRLGIAAGLETEYIRMVSLDEYQLLMSLDVKDLDFIEAVEAMKIMDSIDCDSPF